MQSDTIIGIVGAVVLVAVMVGVFAYEYNNVAPTGEGLDPTSDAAKMAAFNETYPGLSAEGDIDGDTIPNYNDTNIDGDTLDNIEDNDTAVHRTFTGNVGQRLPSQDPADTATKFWIDPGHKGGTITVNWATTANPAGGVIDDLIVSVTGGDVTCDNTGDGTATCDLAAAASGEYTITVRHAQPTAQEKAFTGDYHIQY